MVPDELGSVGKRLHRGQQAEAAVVIADGPRHGLAVESVLGLDHQGAELAAKYVGHLLVEGAGWGLCCVVAAGGGDTGGLGRRSLKPPKYHTKHHNQAVDMGCLAVAANLKSTKGVACSRRGGRRWC